MKNKYGQADTAFENPVVCRQQSGFFLLFSNKKEDFLNSNRIVSAIVIRPNFDIHLYTKEAGAVVCSDSGISA